MNIDKHIKNWAYIFENDESIDEEFVQRKTIDKSYQYVLTMARINAKKPEDIETHLGDIQTIFQWIQFANSKYVIQGSNTQDPYEGISTDEFKNIIDDSIKHGGYGEVTNTHIIKIISMDNFKEIRKR